MDYSEILKMWLNTYSGNTVVAKLRYNLEIVKWLGEQSNCNIAESNGEKLYNWLNGPAPKCLCGNNCKFKNFNKGYNIGCHLGNKCKSTNISRVAKQKSILLEKYGVANPIFIPGIKEKIVKTSNEK